MFLHLIMELIVNDNFAIFKNDDIIYVPQYADKFNITFIDNNITLMIDKSVVIIDLTADNNEFIYYFSDLRCTDFMTNLSGKVFHIIGKTYKPDQMYKTMRVNEEEMLYLNPSETYFAIITNDEEYYQIGPDVRPCYKTDGKNFSNIGEPVYCRSDYSFAIHPLDKTKMMVQFVHLIDVYYVKSDTMSYKANPQNFDIIIGTGIDNISVTGASKYYSNLEQFLNAKCYKPHQITSTESIWTVDKLKIYITTKKNKDTVIAQVYNKDKTSILGISVSKCTMDWFTAVES